MSRNPWSAITKKDKKFILSRSIDDEISRIEQRKRECTEHISHIADRLSRYLTDHCKKGIPVSQESAINKLHSFFARYGLQVGTENLASVKIKPEEYESDYYIARFIFKCKDEQDPLYQSIIDLVKGYFLRLAIYIQPENGNIQAASFANTSFVLDTPVLIDLLGYKGEERRNNVDVLLKMLKRQKAKLYYFPHIKQEVIDILTAYKYSLISSMACVGGRTLEGLDLRGFNASDVEREIQLLGSKLEGVFNIVEFDLPAYATKANDSVDESQVLDEAGIKQYVKENTPHYTEDNLDNDLASVLAIHRLRAGVTSRNIESCHFIFVTNNIDFIHTFNKYYRENVDKETFQLTISVNSLSAIAWIKCGEVDHLSETELLKNAYCAMQPIPEITVKLEEVLSKLKESGKIQPEQVVALRASRVFQNDLWINSFGDVEAVNEFSVQRAKKKYEDSLIAEEKEKYTEKVINITKNYNEYIRKRDEADKLKEKRQNEDIRRRADEFARNEREKWLKPRITLINISVKVLCALGVAGLVASLSLNAPFWVLVLLCVFLVISAVSVYDTVHSKKKIIFTYLNKMSYHYETRVREEKIAEYSNLLHSQDSVSEDNTDQLIGA